MVSAYERPLVAALLQAIEHVPALLHLVTGPRQVGKTTAVQTVMARWPGRSRYAAADRFVAPAPEWIVTQWEAARLDARGGPALLVLDEVHKVPRWSEVVKGEWDADRIAGLDLRVVLLGSSAMLLAKGTSESLAGRFLLHRCPHWRFGEVRTAFGWDVDRFVYFGGYPGAAPLADDEALWRTYVVDSLIETTLGRDVLALETVNKPALLRQVFSLACSSPAQIVSYTKMLGQLQDAGNAATVAHYVDLLGRAFLVNGLGAFSERPVRMRASSPKLVPLSNALVSALGHRSFAESRADAAWWGRLVENAVLAHLVNGLAGTPAQVSWWREGDAEVDAVVRKGSKLWAVEVKTGRVRAPRGLEAFLKAHRGARPLLVGRGGIGFEEFLGRDPVGWFLE